MENTTTDSILKGLGIGINIDSKSLYSIIGGSVGLLILIILALSCTCCSKNKRVRRRQPNSSVTVVVPGVVPAQAGTNATMITLHDGQGDRPRNQRKKGKTKLNKNRPARYNRYIHLQVPPPQAPVENRSLTDDPKIDEMARAITRKITSVLENIKIDPSQIKKLGHLGSGRFGIVYKGELVTQQGKVKKEVALKTIAGDADNEVEMANFMDELIKMANFKHPNVMPIIGLTIMREKPYIVLPFMHNGDLRSYISQKKKAFKVNDLLKMALQVAKGMDYLTKQNLIHGDLAARNCMVDKKEQVKVADFGLSRHLYQSDYYTTGKNDKTPRPIRWMAIESIVDNKYSAKSDVWSFGVLLWELTTRGMRPYSDTYSNEEVISKVKRGYRMPRPKYCDEPVYDIMTKCWDEDPHNRPNFSDIIIMIAEMVGEDDEYLSPKTED